MSLNLLHIAEGWAKTFGLLEMSQEEIQLAQERLNVCAECPDAKQSKVLEIIKGSMEKLDTIYCTKCLCPCNEKVKVKNENCPLSKW